MALIRRLSSGFPGITSPPRTPPFASPALLSITRPLLGASTLEEWQAKQFFESTGKTFSLKNLAFPVWDHPAVDTVTRPRTSSAGVERKLNIGWTRLAAFRYISRFLWRACPKLNECHTLAPARLTDACSELSFNDISGWG